MVLETIGAIHIERPTVDNPKDDAVLSPLSAATEEGVATPSQQAVESRDAAVATPCDSIRMYANELAASKSISVSREPSRESGEVGEGRRAETSMGGEEREPPNPPGIEPPAARGEVPSKSTTATDQPSQPDPNPSQLVSVNEATIKSQVNTSLEPSISQTSTPAYTRSSSPRVTLITATNIDECKLNLSNNDDGNAMERSRSGESCGSRESVEIIAEEPVINTEEANGDNYKAADETTVEEDDDNHAEESDPKEEAKLKEESAIESNDQGGESTQLSPEMVVIKFQNKALEQEPKVEASAEPEAVPAAINETDSKRKRFGLKKLSRPGISVPTIPLSRNKPATPRGLTLPKPPLSKPPLSKSSTSVRKFGKPMKPLGLSMKFRSTPPTAIPLEEPRQEAASKPEETFTQKEEVLTTQEVPTAPEVLPRQEIEGKTPAKPEVNEEITSKQGTILGKQDGPKKEEMATIDLHADDTKKIVLAQSSESPGLLISPVPSASPPAPFTPAVVGMAPSLAAVPSIPTVQTKQSYSAFFLQQNTPTQAREMMETKEGGVGNFVGIPIKPQVTETVGLFPRGADRGTLSADMAGPTDAVPASMASGLAPIPQTQQSETNFIDSLYAKAESCLDDITIMCGPKKKEIDLKKAQEMKGEHREELAKPAVTMSVAVGATSIISNGPLGPRVVVETPTIGDSNVVGDDNAFTTVAEISTAPSAASANVVQEISDTLPTPQEFQALVKTSSKEMARSAFGDLFTPLSIATEQASSFIDTIKSNESLKSIVENLSKGVDEVSAGFDNVAKATEAAVFSHQSEEEAKSEEGGQSQEVPREKSEEEKLQEKLDRAAEMARRALDNASGAEAATGGGGAGVNEEDSEVRNKPRGGGKLFRRVKQSSSSSSSPLKIFTSKSHQLAAIASTPTSPSSPVLPSTTVASPRLSNLKRGLSTKKRIAATRTRSAANKSGEAAWSSFLRFKKPSVASSKSKGGKISGRGLHVSSPKSKKDNGERSIALEEVVQGDLESASLNSQSLNEPSSPLVVEERPGPIAATIHKENRPESPKPLLAELEPKVEKAKIESNTSKLKAKPTLLMEDPKKIERMASVRGDKLEAPSS